MIENNNATCSICGKDYHKCISCNDEMVTSPWKKYTDTSEHYKIYQILHGFSTGVYDKDEAKSKLQMVDLSDMNSFRDSIKNTIKRIMKEDRKAAVKTKITASPIEEKTYLKEASEYGDDIESNDSI